MPIRKPPRAAATMAGSSKSECPHQIGLGPLDDPPVGAQIGVKTPVQGLSLVSKQDQRRDG